MTTKTGGWIRRAIAAASIAAAVALAATGCTQSGGGASSGNEQSPTLQKVLDDGILKVGIAETIPNAWKDSQGQWQGYNVEVARALAKELDVKVEFVEASQKSWIPQLKSGAFDVNMLGWFMTPPRAVQVGFTVPVFVKGYSFVVKADSPVESIEQLNDPKYSVTGLVGGSEETVAKTYTPKAEAKFLASGGPLDGALSVQSDRATAWIYPSDVIKPFLAQNPWARVLNTEPVWNNPLAYAIRKGDPEWKFFLDSYITKIKASGELDGWIAKAEKDAFQKLSQG